MVKTKEKPKEKEETQGGVKMPQVKMVHIDSLRAHPRNPRVHPESLISKLKGSIEEFGWTNPVLVTEDGIIIAGHARTKAARAMGVMEVPVIVLPLQGNQVEAYLIADNRLAEESEWDIGTLKDLIADLDTGDFNLELTGFDMAELETLFGGSLRGGSPDSATGEDGTNDLAPVFSVFPKDAIIESAFTYFRETGFQYPALPQHVSFQAINRLAAYEDEDLVATSTALGVSDKFHPHRYHQGTEVSPSLYQAFMSDKSLRRALEKAFEFGGVGGGSIGKTPPGTLRLVDGTHNASNFRPGYALYLYRKFCPNGGTIFDTSAGHGGRLVGFVAFGGGARYIGIDPHMKAHEGNLALAEEMGVTDRVELYCIPAEDVDVALVKGRCDFAFTSPPYFSKEWYSGEETQSYLRYPDAEMWRDKFLRKMLILQYEALKPDCFNAVNIADVRIKKDRVPLAQWTMEIAKEIGFEFIETMMYPIAKQPGKGVNSKENTKFQGGPKAFEPIFLFRKPE